MSKLYVNSISPSTSATISIVSASFSATTISASDIVGNVSNALTASLATTDSYV